MRQGSFPLGERVAELLTIILDQRVGHRLQIAGNDLIKLIERQPDAVVGYPIIGEIIGANPLAAVA